MSIPEVAGEMSPENIHADALTTVCSLSVLTATKGNASKTLMAGSGGLPIKGKGSLAIPEGQIEHVQVAGLAGLQALLATIQPNQALVHGVVKGSVPGEVFPLTTCKNLPDAPRGTITRSLNHITHPAEVFLLMWDRDPDAADPTQLATAEELLQRLACVLPGVDLAGRLVTLSTTSAIRSKATKEWLIPPSGMHVYQLVRGDLTRFKDLLTVRLWAAGLGYCKLASPDSRTGVAAVLSRALVDLTVFSPERLDYVAGAKIAAKAPFYQDRGAPVLMAGDVLDLDAFPDVTPEERQAAQDRQMEAKAALAPERFRLATVAAGVETPSLTNEQREALATQRLTESDRCELPADFLLFFAHRAEAVRVDALGKKYDGWRLADPLEPTYRDGTDAVFHWRDGDWRIVSFAHGLKKVYRLVPQDPDPPPEDDEDMEHLIAQVEGHTPSRNGTARMPTVSATTDEDYPYSDAYNAACLIQTKGKLLRYCSPWKSWLVWSGTHWARDTTGIVMRWQRQTIKALSTQIPELSDAAGKVLMDHIKGSLNTSRLDAAIRQAQSWEGVSVGADVFDTNPWLLNCTNGTLDLQTGILRPHQQADLLTKCLTIPYDKKATCDAWKAFLWRIMGGTPTPDDPDMGVGELEKRAKADTRAAALIAFLQRAIGYSLTGSTREQCLFILHGPTKTGKSTFLATMRRLLGPYGTQADMESFMHKDRQEVRNDLATLAGSRFVCALESQEGRRLNEALIKQLTGGVDNITARFLFQEYFEFPPQFKVFLGTNHLPKIGMDDAVWERIRRVPFEVQIPKEDRDKTLDEQLQQELVGILAWAVRGCVEWKALGELNEPEAVINSTDEYREEMNTLVRFIEERCTRGDPAVVKYKAPLLASAYVAWCKRASETPLANRELIHQLERLGYQRALGTGNQYYWHGIGLVNADDEHYD